MIASLPTAHDSDCVARAAIDLHRLHVPIVCCACGPIASLASMILHACDYRIGESSACIDACVAFAAQRAGKLNEVVCGTQHALERTERIAAWLTQHPPTGLRHMLALMRSDPDLSSLTYPEVALLPPPITLRKFVHCCASPRDAVEELCLGLPRCEAAVSAGARGGRTERRKPCGSGSLGGPWAARPLPRQSV